MIKIVGNCPKCGAPIYWDTQLGEGVPANIRTCQCLFNIPIAYPSQPNFPPYPSVPPYYVGDIPCTPGIVTSGIATSDYDKQKV